MPSVKCLGIEGRVLTSALLVVATLGVTTGASRAQDGAPAKAPARLLDRSSAAMEAMQTQRWRRAEQHRRMERAQAHARMPSTMYASTPSRESPPHPFPLDVGAKRTVERSAARAPAQASARSTAGESHGVPLFASASDPRRRGFVRIINHTGEAGTVRIDAFDDTGTQYGPLTLAMDADESVHFNSGDLEAGNASKGLEGATGPGEGHWRLALTSALDIEVLAYMRTPDGFLTSMHDLVPETEAGHRVTIFNPGSNTSRVSWLRLVNPGAEAAEITIEGIDDRGRSPGSAVRLSLPAQASRTLTARELELGEAEGVSGALGDGAGKWQLVVTADRPIQVMSLLSSTTGHLTNLSSAPDHAESDEAGATTTHHVPLFPSARWFTREGRLGFVRVINRTDEAGEVRIDAFDNDGVPYGPLTLSIDAGATLHFNSTDLEQGNAGKGLSGGIGAGTGDWRLRMRTSLDLDVLAYIRTDDGFLTSMHDLAPETTAGRRVATFNPGSNTNQVSWLRLVNPGAEAAEITIEGIDDRGESPGSAVRFSMPAGASRTVTAQQLESGGGLNGALGNGAGKWQLVVTADRPVQVMSLLSSPTGHLTNLSSAPGGTAGTETAADVFREHISGPVVQSKCINCHVKGGVSGNTRLVFAPSSNLDHEAFNLRVFKDFLAEVENGVELLLNKIQGVAHGGGAQVPAGSVDFAHMKRFLSLLGEDVFSAAITPQTLFDTVRMAPVRKTLRRAALIFAGRNPTEEEYAAVTGGGAAALRATIRGLMTGPQFHEFLIRASNDRLLTDRRGGVINNGGGPLVDFINETYRRAAAALANGEPRHVVWDWDSLVQYGARRAPLELIAHVVENDLPYTEILTADYIMANPWATAAYGASEDFDHPIAVLDEFKPTRFESYYRDGAGYEARFDPVVDATRILDPGSLSTNYPHAGVLNTTAFLGRYPTTATNRNRARSRWTYYHFLGLDIEKSASRTTDPEALADTNNPTMRNPACTVCHSVLDPVAGAFQNYSEGGDYRDQRGGLDSLDSLYKESEGMSLPVRADSWGDRNTLSWPLPLAAGVETLRVVFTNPFHDESTDDQGHVNLDRLRVTDARGRVLVSHEFEDLEPPTGDWGGPCGETRNGYLLLHWGAPQCAIFIDVEIPSDGIYDIEIVAWAEPGRHKRYGEDGFARLAVASDFYQEGDTWYRDMRAPGFDGETAPNPDNSVQWLAERIVADERFAEATVKFWWPAIMGNEVAEPPEDEGDTDFEGRLLAANAQGAEVERLARGFRRGFNDGSKYNLKDLLVEIVLSKWFRADAVDDVNPIRRVALRDAGAKRLLTPEELDRKTLSLTGIQWGRHIRTNCWPRCKLHPSRLTDDLELMYGGIDSDGITERARDITSVMTGVAKRHAADMSCLVVMREFYLLPEAERRLFADIDKDTTEARTIRNKLVELHDVLLGVRVTPHSPDVEAAYRLFVDVMERGREAREDWFRFWECSVHQDIFYFEGILDDTVVWIDDMYGEGYRIDTDRVDPYLNSFDWSDPHHAVQAWMVVLAYLLTDYRYLYL